VNISKDLKVWQHVNTVEEGTFYSTPDHVFIATDFSLQHTSDLLHWETPDFGFAEMWTNVFPLNGKFIVEGIFNITNPEQAQAQYYASSDGGHTFKPLPLPPFTTVTYEELQYARDNYIALSKNTIYTTMDCETWKSTVINVTFNLEVLLFSNAGPVIGTTTNGSFVEIYYSTDLKKWEQVFKSGGASKHSYSIATNYAGYVLHLDSQIFTSSDGKSWSQPDKSLKVDNSSTLYFVGNYYFLFGQTSTQVSKDGTTWQVTNIPVTLINEYSLSVSFVNGYGYVAVGEFGQIAVSSDAINWEVNKPPYSIPNAHWLTAITYDNHTWVAIDNDAGIYVQSA